MEYPVDGRSAQAVLQQLADRGPNGFWAYTSWYVRWSGNCVVTLQIDYTMPRHTRPESLHPSLRQRWVQMVKALHLHERKHGAHGIAAARELVQKNCRNGNAIVQKWADQDRILDKRTDHGASDGVVFP